MMLNSSDSLAFNMNFAIHPCKNHLTLLCNEIQHAAIVFSGVPLLAGNLVENISLSFFPGLGGPPAQREHVLDNYLIKKEIKGGARHKHPSSRIKSIQMLERGLSCDNCMPPSPSKKCPSGLTTAAAGTICGTLGHIRWSGRTIDGIIVSPLLATIVLRDGWLGGPASVALSEIC